MKELKNKLKTIISDMIFNIGWFSILLYFVMFYFEYTFNNMIYNSILLYIFAHFISLFFTISSLTLYSIDKSKDYMFDKKEFFDQEQELRFHHPKLFIYNRIIFGVFMVMKIIAWIMLVYGIGLYYLK